MNHILTGGGIGGISGADELRARLGDGHRLSAAAARQQRSPVPEMPHQGAPHRAPGIRPAITHRPAEKNP